jgi:peroxiredoxin
MKATFLTLFALLAINIGNIYSADLKPIEIGTKAPDFKLKGVDGKNYSLKNFKKADVLVILFTCNHCPTAQAYEDRVINLANTYKSKGVSFVAISPNDPTAVRFDELAYSDLDDSYEHMKLRARAKNFPFPYLFDGKTQAIAKLYGPIATPHIFVFDKNRVLKYQGRIDDVENPAKTPTTHDAKNAIEAVIAGKTPAVQTTKVFGCSIKWASKSNWLDEYRARWAKEEVSVNEIDEKGIQEIFKNNTDKVRVVNLWATWCGPCVSEFPSLVEINRTFRERDFEFISISADEPQLKDKVLKFLKKEQSSSPNYLFNGTSKYTLIDAVGSGWQGALPFTAVIEPGGKVIYAKEGVIDPAKLKTAVVESKPIGRFFKNR